MKPVFVFFLTIFISSALFSGISYSGNKTLTEAIAEINGSPIISLERLDELNAVEINRPFYPVEINRPFYLKLGMVEDEVGCVCFGNITELAEKERGGAIKYNPDTLRPLLTEEKEKISCEELIKRSPEEVSQYATSAAVAFSDDFMEQHGSDFSDYDKGYLSNKFILGSLVYMALNCKRPKNKDAALKLVDKFEAGVREAEYNKLLPTASEAPGFCSRISMAFMRLFEKI